MVTNNTDEEVKDHFYEKLQVIVEKTQKHDLLVITVCVITFVLTNLYILKCAKPRNQVGRRQTENGSTIIVSYRQCTVFMAVKRG